MLNIGLLKFDLWLSNCNFERLGQIHVENGKLKIEKSAWIHNQYLRFTVKVSIPEQMSAHNF